MTGGARTVAGSEPYGVTGSVGSFSLYLPAGSSAQLALRFTELTGASQIDDVYVDPRMHY